MALVVLQAGHCFRKTGATGTGGLDASPTEQEFAWAACNRAATMLRDAGHQARVVLADVASSEYRGDAFAAVHCDGSTSRSARGASVGYRTSEGQRFAAAWKRHYQAAGWAGGWRPDNYTSALAGYYGTKRAVGEGNRHAFIAEAGFLTNPQDEALLSLPHGPERFARALTAAVVELFGGHIPAPDVPEEEDDMPYLLITAPNRPAALLMEGKPLAKLRDASSIGSFVAAGVKKVAVSTVDYDSVERASAALVNAVVSVDDDV